MQNEVWIGLVGVIPRNEHTILEEDKGAYTNILALADNESSYKIKVSQLVDKYMLELIEIEDVEKFEDRLKEYVVDEELIKLAKIVLETGETLFGTLHTW